MPDRPEWRLRVRVCHGGDVMNRRVPADDAALRDRRADTPALKRTAVVGQWRYHYRPLLRHPSPLRRRDPISACFSTTHANLGPRLRGDDVLTEKESYP